MTAAQRSAIEDEIERLIGLLDTADGDADLEPSLGWSRTMATSRFDNDSQLLDMEAA